eukprot:361809-Chlamydomonas_euryale.AAC.1
MQSAAMTWISPMRTVTGQPLSARRALLGLIVGTCAQGMKLTGQAIILLFARQLTRQEKKEMQLGASLLPCGCLEQARMLKRKPSRPPKALALAAAGQ